jgi:hypothetical protein
MQLFVWSWNSRNIHYQYKRPLKCNIKCIRGSFQKFCTLYVFSSKMNLFYKIHLQAFNVIFIVLYHIGPTFGLVLYSCLDAFVVDESDYSGHLIRHNLNASEAFPTEWFLQFWEQVKVWWAQFHLNRVTVRQQCWFIVPKAVYTVKSAPEDGRICRPKHVGLI